MSEYLTNSDCLTPYMVFPSFLLDIDISETARILYMLLLDSIYVRILEVCVPIKINNQNIRIINRKANFKEMATLLSGSENSSDIDNS